MKTLAWFDDEKFSVYLRAKIRATVMENALKIQYTPLVLFTLNFIGCSYIVPHELQIYIKLEFRILQYFIVDYTAELMRVKTSKTFVEYMYKQNR